MPNGNISNLPTIQTSNSPGSDNYLFVIYSSKFSSFLEFYNENDIREFYTGSLESKYVGTGLYNNYDIADFEDEFLDPFFDYKNNSDYIGNKRLFLTLVTSSASGSNIPGNQYEAIRTISKDTMPEGERFNTENLAEISTIELVNTIFTTQGNTPQNSRQNLKYVSTRRTKFNYWNGNAASSTTSPIPGILGSAHMFNLCDDVVPSLLLNLPKEEHLPDGIGRKGFVIVPENIHPHIKQNLVHYLAKAGISLGTDVVPALDNTYRKLM